ncbi:MAG: hypothetical protein RDV48_02810 [Candidatus Eremiobacteraeota bacterium]|nr:hypothetical protein [Candidatus Eremiobacteraeota bacterium]
MGNKGKDDEGWLQREVDRKRREKEAMASVFSGAQKKRQESQEALQELMKKEEESPEEKGGPLYTPLAKDLDLQTEKKKAMAKVFSSEQERREKQRQALKAWMLGEEKKEES